MNQTQLFDQICDTMTNPQSYPHAVDEVVRLETHISVVFLTGTFVYKLKKSKSLEFLDFRKPSDRKHFCEEEVRLNQRLSTGIYMEVVNIAKDPEGNIRLEAKGEVIEYAVKMVQLPENLNFQTLLTKGKIAADQVIALAEKLASFYQSAETNDHINTFGEPDLIGYNMEENFRQIYPFVEKLIPSEKWEFICQVSRSFLKDHEALFRHRIKKGRIRDGHGDLRCDHIYFTDTIQIIDCIEFNERFRYGDTALDMAFLFMDLEHRGHSDIALLLLSSFAKQSKDPEIYALLDFYAAYRALIRLKIACFTLEQTTENKKTSLLDDIKRYLNQAYTHAVLFGRPTLWIFCGLPASGKSTLAKKITDSLSMPLYASDVIRKQDQETPKEEVVAFNTGPYQPVLRGWVYAELLNLAQEQLKNGNSVALDATFSDPKWQEAAVQLARDIDAGLIFVECACSPDTMRQRLEQREGQTGQSDARLVHFENILKNASPIMPEDPNTHLTIDTDQPQDQAFYNILSGAYKKKHAQTRILLTRLNNT